MDRDTGELRVRRLGGPDERGRRVLRWAARFDACGLNIGAIDALIVRRDTLVATIDEFVPDSPGLAADSVARLRCLRGIDTLTAVGLCAEIGD